MIVKFDSLNRAETPLFTLCNPGSVCSGGVLSKVIGGLVDHEAEEIVFNFNSTSELNMRVNRIPHEDIEDNNHISTLYKAIQNRRLIFVDDIGFFVITEVRDGFSNGLHFKDIRAESVEYELSQKMVPFIEDGTYKFKSNTFENDGILDKIIASLPLWSIGHVDEDIASKYRTFEDVDTSTNCLSFLLESVQDAYECIIVFDCINRVVNVYSQENYVNKTDIQISQSDFINSIEITEDASNLYTAIRVLGNEDVMISAVNPIGTNVIYNFSYYTDWMSKTLSEKVKEWQSLIKENEEEYRTLNLSYYEQLEQANTLNLELKKIASQITMYERCRDNIVAGANDNLINDYNEVIKENGGTPITIYDEISQTVDEINNLIQKCKSDNDETVLKLDEVNAQIDVIKPKIAAIQGKLALQSYFTGEELDELNYYIYEGNYTDEYVTFTDIMSYSEKFDQMIILYNRAVTQLNKVSVPTQEFAVDAENFVFIKEFEKWSNQLETGSLVSVELSQDEVAELFLSNITINYDDKTLSMTFGNRFNKFDPKSLFENVLGNISKSANTLEYIKDIILPIKNGEFNVVKEAIQSSRDITMGAALSSRNEEVIIDGSGYTGRNLLKTGEYDPKQIKITGRNIVFTDDSWDSCKTAIGDLVLGDGKSVYGINAESIIGDIIIGNNLRILDNNGNDMFVVMDGKIVSAVQEVTNTIKGDLNSMQSQIDGQIQTWFDSYVPTADNAPASSWATEEEKINHLGDIFYIVENETIGGQAFRWAQVSGVYQWVLIEDMEVAKALADAARAQDTADGKRRVFVSQPVPPYDVGDLWAQGDSGDLMRCNAARTDGDYAAEDWGKASDYTNDDALHEFVDGEYAGTKDTVANQGQQISTQEARISNLEVNADSISATVQRVQTDTKNSLEGLNQSVQELTQQVSLTLTPEQVDIVIDQKLAQGVEAVRTSTGFTFDEEGLTVSKTGSEMSTQVTEDGMTISRSGTEVLVVDNKGVQATNLSANTFLIIGGKARFEKYGAGRIGCFWIGG